MTAKDVDHRPPRRRCGARRPDRPPRRQGRRIAGAGATELLLEPERARELDREPDRLSPTTASKDDYQSAAPDVESAWDQVKTDAGDLNEVSTSALDSAWDSFKSAVDDVPDDASVSDALNDVSQAAQSLLSTTKSTLTGPDCSSS